MKKLILLASAVFLVAGTQIVLNLAPTADITIEALSPVQLENLGLTSHPSGGLDVVGVGELVYLSGADADGEAVTAYSWMLTGPGGSVATLDSTGTAWNTFRPDVTGDYTVSLNVTTASGTADASVLITAGTYVGVDGGSPACASCHFNTKNDWAGTGHSDMFTLAIDGLKSAGYNETCIECHTVGYNTDPEADNGGFDDVQALLGWLFPDTLVAGNWDDIVQNYALLAEKANIQCENCHGPGSEHTPSDPDNKRIAVSIDAGMCGRCHEDEPYHRRNLQWAESAHATGTSFARGNNSSTCAPCHSGWGFIDRQQDKSVGAPDYWEPGLGAQNLTCAVCHDPHKSSVEGDHQLRTIADFTLVNGVTVTRGGTGKLCMNCHQARREANEYVTSFSGGTFRGAHHSVQTDVLFGQNAFTFGQVLPNSTHNAALENTCASCHMYPTPGAGMPGRDMVGDHTFAVTVDDGVMRVDNTAACERCHGQFDAFADFMARNDDDGDGTVEAVQEEVHGLLEEVAKLLPPFGSTEITADSSFFADPANMLYRKGLWNYLMMEEEGSFGVHNYQYSVAVLKLTKLALEFGVLDSGMIMAIDDVPNDQGRQLGVMWNRFGGDGVSDTPLQDYYVWRRVDGSMGKVSQANVLESIEAVPTGDKAAASVGKMSVVMDGHLWTAVGHQPAASMDLYSAVVPTLADSTDAGAYWSVFKVSGHAEDSQTYVVSAPDSAYSVDNLDPMAPMLSLAGVDSDPNNPAVNWIFEFDREDPLNVDFNYFAVYRGIRNFNAATREPIATTTEFAFRDEDVEFGKTYFYTVAAFDFSGNRSEFAPVTQVAVVVGVEGTGEVPTEFALHQNYPNPFNPSTTITYDVPSTSVVRIDVHDLLGRRIQTLVDGEVAPGKHRAVFDASELSSGLYVIRFETPEKAFERTVMLVK